MSQAARDHLAQLVVFRGAAQRADILSDAQTQTQLIAMLLDITAAAQALGCFILLTMVRNGHGDDGPHGHFGGYAADGWLLKSKNDGQYVDATDPRFAQWLKRCAASPWTRQLAVAGSAYTPANIAACGSKYVDDGPHPATEDDHVHWGSIYS
jgi:hypothetical protein